ncbi:hypothetical protein BC828DRAFT_405208 [Blastocladiella britannica]|nr:hypothetical protein BC828DRAFT_405208 [Blastocladiella britannica]
MSNSPHHPSASAAYSSAQGSVSAAPTSGWRIHRGPVNNYATVDDRFTFPPVPGYTGYIPRNRNHFGRPYAITTLAALQSFESQCASKSKLPPKVEALLQAGDGYAQVSADDEGPAMPTQPEGRPRWLDSEALVSNPNSASTTQKIAVRVRRDEGVANHPTGHRALVLQKRARAKELQAQCEQDHMFLPGYTGFIPRERQRFGEQYQKSATAAMHEFKALDRAHDAHVHALEVVAQLAGTNADSARAVPTQHDKRHVVLPGALGSFSTAPPPALRAPSPPHGLKSTSTTAEMDDSDPRAAYRRPIPGYTGYHRLHAQHIGGVRADARDPEEPHAPGEDGVEGMPKKDLSETLPIPGYKGFLPLYQLAGEHSFGHTAKQCISEYKSLLKEHHKHYEEMLSRNDARAKGRGGQ